jgi:hypothetical protein
MEKRAVIRASVFATLLTLCLLPRIAQAANVTVSCPPESGGTYTSIAAALNAVGQVGPITFTVTGTCNENVFLSNAQSLTFVAGPGGARIVQPQDSDTFDISSSQDIALNNLEIVGVPGSMPGSGGGGVSIDNGSNVATNGCNIHDNEAFGVSAGDGSRLGLFNTIIHNNNPGDGLDVGDSTAFVSGSTIRDNGTACPGGGWKLRPGRRRGPLEGRLYEK